MQVHILRQVRSVWWQRGVKHLDIFVSHFVSMHYNVPKEYRRWILASKLAIWLFIWELVLWCLLFFGLELKYRSWQSNGRVNLIHLWECVFNTKGKVLLSGFRSWIWPWFQVCRLVAGICPPSAFSRSWGKGNIWLHFWDFWRKESTHVRGWSLEDISRWNIGAQRGARASFRCESNSSAPIEESHKR